ncbi:hypothetical protein OY671_010770, partial [Metschnikowia pulcherrima]
RLRAATAAGHRRRHAGTGDGQCRRHRSRQLRGRGQPRRHQDRHADPGSAAVDLGGDARADGSAERAERDRGAALRARRGGRDLRRRPQGLRSGHAARLQRPGHQRLQGRPAPDHLGLPPVPQRAVRARTHRGAARPVVGAVWPGRRRRRHQPRQQAAVGHAAIRGRAGIRQ